MKISNLSEREYSKEDFILEAQRQGLPKEQFNDYAEFWMGVQKEENAPVYEAYQYN